MSTPTPPLDREELLHLAMAAIDRDDTEGAIGYLKRMLQLDDADGTALYLLGAVHATIGMNERALTEMTEALEYEPDLHIARFQVGLIHAMEGDFEAARGVWARLDRLGEDDPLRLFKRGIEHFIDDEYPACIADLTRGIELNDDNPSLNEDMQRMLNNARAVMKEQGEEEPAPPAAEAGGRHVLLSAYDDPEPQ